ncbi:mechanosensitive ion channel domain-containing protein [Marinagarivorans cellulosilyticus]|uniref:Potassium-dependent mechanosensitive channel n=1 Tax=Marinagarivorans cellulosilyticus TaxID=2721545 RepID=A0AAN1WHR1_9GAMM|nr:mechanosensitive ion channel domain-containing protein [Marinagarivorans cellulosilyticus]BCD97822.1 potassium-dependent mechanosensitive channel [Marinagarivorans cellulosilyticus]
MINIQKASTRAITVLIFCGVTWLSVFPAASVADDIEFQGHASVNASEVESQLARLEDNADLSPEFIEKLKVQYKAVLENLAKQSGFLNKASEYRKIQLQADEHADQLTEELKQRQGDRPQLRIPENASVAETQKQLSREEAKLLAVKGRLLAIEKEQANPANTVSAARQRLSNINLAQEKLQGELAKISVGVTSNLQQAEQWLLLSKKAVLDAEEKMLELKLASAPMQTRLLAADHALQLEIQRELARNIERLQRELNEKRSTEAQVSREATQALSASAVGLSDDVEQYVKGNKALSLELTELAQKLNDKTQRSQLAKDQLELINNRYRMIKKKLEITGLSHALGSVLTERSNDLPQIAGYHKEHDELLEEISKTALRKLELQNDVSLQHHLEQDKKRLLASLNSTATGENKQWISDVVANRLSLLEKLESEYAAYMRVLSDVDFDLLELIDVTNRFDEFLVRQLMWVRTSPSIISYTTTDILNEGVLLIDYLGNVDYKAAVANVFGRLWVWLILFVISAIVIGQSWLKSRQKQLEQAIAQAPHASLVPALQYVFGVLVRSAPLALLAFVLSRTVDAAVIPKAHEKLISLLWVYLFCADFTARLLHSNGFVSSYFRWPQELIHDLFKGFKRLRNTVVIPLLVVSIIPWHLFASKGTGFMGTVLLSLIMCFLAYSINCFLSVQYSLVGSIQQRRLVRPASKLQIIARLIMVGGPIVWAISLLAGYRYASIVLCGRVFETILVLPFIVFAYQLAERGLMEFQSRVKYHQATADDNAAAMTASPKVNDESIPPVEEQKTRSVDELAIETQKLLKSVFLLLTITTVSVIWLKVLPALAIFEEVVLWNTTSVVAGEETAVAVTLKSLLFILVGAFVAYITARRLPAFIEMVLLNRINMSNGSRYAITTLMSYALLGLAVSFIGNSIGFGWDKIQWAVAALSVGIGFGLQEIVANFISGIIILFERPIRVGDLVTINGQTGVVHRIQIRATTLRDFDNKELLVPNKEFITSSLLNWTLSDKEVRVLIPVGIAYGSDVDKALALLEEAALEHPLVLSTPAPVVTFEAFGDNALSLYLRCRIGSVDDRLSVVTDLHRAINDKYMAAAISIAFPQRDLHVDFAAPLEVVLKKPAPKAPA